VYSVQHYVIKWVKLQVEIFCKASRRRALQKICTCSLTHDVSSLEDDNVFLKLNAERTIKQNKAAETGKNIAFNYTVTCIITDDVCRFLMKIH
jgi:hypothetical protein